MNGELPQGWASVALGDLFDFKYGKGLPQEKRNAKGSVKVFGSNGVVGVHNSALTKGPTIIVGRKGSVGEVHLSPDGCWPIDTTYFIDEFPEKLPPTYWALYLKSLHLGEQEKSSAIPGISRDDVYTIEALLPPLAEQRRIVMKVETLLGKMDACQQRLAKIPALLKRFRQSVLDAACTGRLTADWREKNVEAAPVRFGLTNDDLPESWRTSPLSEVVRVTSGEAFKKSEYSNSGAKLLQIANVSFGKIIWEQQNFLPLSYLKSHADLVLKEGDILMALNRPLLNWRIKVARLTKADLPAILYQRVGRFSFIGGERSINAEFLFLYLQSLGFIHELSERLHGTDQPYVNPPEMLGILFPVPPLLEQQEIVRRVKSLFTLGDRIEARFAEGRKRVDSITQAILAKAFRGELVPTEFELAEAEGRSFESAEQLLKRIKVTGSSSKTR